MYAQRRAECAQELFSHQRARVNVLINADGVVRAGGVEKCLVCAEAVGLADGYVLYAQRVNGHSLEPGQVHAHPLGALGPDGGKIAAVVGKVHRTLRPGVGIEDYEVGLI